ncbi:DUF805 domain-containing protein [Terricaulis silvestris]|uniref:Putative membrane protein n=1 Tax=Terricaulis silvestris TaxID=2686094 RepID=A0A6I6MQR6_9CAUL|nr:DUF805 domain-containing protein [Terricaulis silvestris]QGZ93912.1 putative membrane protein [Terricaulis silvestris]
MGLVSLLFGFNGRINRAQYWLGTIGVNVVNWVVMLAMAGTSAVPAEKNPAAALAAASSQLAMILPLSVGVAWIAMALQVKRFHDRGQSGWWSLLPIAPVLLMVGNVFAAIAEQWPAERLFSSMGLPFLALIVISVGFFVNLGCLGSKDGPNKYDHTPGKGGGGPVFAPGGAPSGASGAASALFGAQSAIDRAVAEQARAAATPRVAPVAAAAARAAAPGSFGRKASR